MPKYTISQIDLIDINKHSDQKQCILLVDRTFVKIGHIWTKKKKPLNLK